MYSLLNYYIFLKHFLNYEQEYFIKVYILENVSLLYINIPFFFFNFKVFPKNEYKMSKMTI